MTCQYVTRCRLLFKFFERGLVGKRVRKHGRHYNKTSDALFPLVSDTFRDIIKLEKPEGEFRGAKNLPG